MTNIDRSYVVFLGNQLSDIYELLSDYNYTHRFSFIELSTSKGDKPHTVCISISNKRPWPFHKYESVFLDHWLDGVSDCVKELIVIELEQQLTRLKVVHELNYKKSQSMEDQRLANLCNVRKQISSLYCK